MNSPFDDIAGQEDCGTGPPVGGREAVGSLGSVAVAVAEVVAPDGQQGLNLKSLAANLFIPDEDRA